MLNLPEKDRIGKISSVIQTVLFFAMLIPIYIVCSGLVRGFWLKLLVFAGNYIVVSLFLYLIIKPMFAIIEDKLREKKK